MKSRLIIVLLAIMTWGGTHAAISFTDSITHVTLNLPNNVEITASSTVAYKKLEANLPDGGTLSVYSVVNPKNETYPWSYLNNFDKNYGSPREDVELEGDINGRRRIYDFNTDSGPPLCAPSPLYVARITLFIFKKMHGPMTSSSHRSL